MYLLHEDLAQVLIEEKLARIEQPYRPRGAELVRIPKRRMARHRQPVVLAVGRPLHQTMEGAN
jgi:hypothetical protein